MFENRTKGELIPDEVLEKAVNGDDDSLGYITSSYHKVIRGWIRDFLPTIPEIELDDCEQEIDIVILKSVGKYKLRK